MSRKKRSRRERTFHAQVSQVSFDLVYYTDGSCEPNPGPGGCAVVLEGECVYLGTESRVTTNNRMEGMAILAALKHADRRPCLIYTDSLYWRNTIMVWAPRWAGRNWTRRDGEVKNLDLVKPIFYRVRETASRVEWIRGHSGIAGNELADHWADIARRSG